MKEEICEEYSRIISIAEQDFVCKGRIVCERCDKELRQKAQQDQELQDHKEPEGVQESEELSESLETQESEEKAPRPHRTSGAPSRFV